MSVIIIHGTIAHELEHHLEHEKQGQAPTPTFKCDGPIKGANKLTASLMTKLQQDVKQYAFESIKGKQLEINQLQLPRRIKIVKNISLGQSHLIAHCVDNFTGDDVIYGMGSNKWG